MCLSASDRHKRATLAIDHINILHKLLGLFLNENNRYIVSETASR